jgi:phage-related protein
MRVNDETRAWRIVYYLDVDAVVILEVFSKTSRATPDAVMKSCRKRLRHYLEAARGKETKR